MAKRTLSPAVLALFFGASPLPADTRGCIMYPSPTGNGIIEGVVRGGAARQPLAAAVIDLTLHGPDGRPLCWFRRTTTDKSGAYVITDLPEGRFSIGANIRVATTPYMPFRGAFYGGVQSQADASLVRLPKGERLTGIDILLSGPLPNRDFKVELAWPDGRPAFFEGVEVYDALGNSAGRVLTDSTGKGVFTGCASTEYVFGAERVGPDGTDVVHAEPVTVATGTAVANVRLVLSSKGYYKSHH